MKKVSILIIAIILATLLLTNQIYAVSYIKDGYIYEPYNISNKFLEGVSPVDMWSSDSYWSVNKDNPLANEPNREDTSVFLKVIPVKILRDREGNIIDSSLNAAHDYSRIKQFETPNYVVLPNGTVITNVFDRVVIRFHYQKSVSQLYSEYDVELTNFGIGGQSKFYLPEAIDIPNQEDIKYIGIWYYTTKAVRSMLVNNTNSNIQGSTFSERIHYFKGSIAASYSHSYVDTQPFLSTRNFKSTVIVETKSEWNEPESPDEYNSIEDLPPVTEGTIYSNSNGMGKVKFSVDNYKVIANVTYPGYDLYIPFTFSSDTDMSIFDESYESFYYVYEGQKFFLINHGNTSMFTTSNIKAQTFVPYTIWNLTTDETVTIDKMNVYLYTKLQGSNHVYAYFYVDQFIIDSLLSASVAMKYQYKYMVGQNGSWQLYQKVLEASTEAVSSRPWQYDFMTQTTIATGVLALIPGVRWPALLVGGGILWWTSQTINKDFLIAGNTNEIEVFNPTSTQLQEINAAYSQNDPTFDGVDDNKNLFRLDLGEFNVPYSTGINIDTNYSVFEKQNGLNIIEFTYQTDGKVYTIVGENIDGVFTPGEGTNEENPTNPLPDLPLDDILKWSKDYWIIILIVALVLIGLPVLGFILSGIASVRNGYNAISQPRYNPRKNYRKSSGIGGLLFFIIVLVSIFLIAKGLR